MNFSIHKKHLIVALLSTGMFIAVANNALTNTPAVAQKTTKKSPPTTKTSTPKQVQKNATRAQKKSATVAKKEVHNAHIAKKKDDKIKALTAQPLVTPKITIKNGVTKNAIGYQKMGMRYPDSFKLTVNGTPLFVKEGETITDHQEISVPADQPLVIKYDYTWYAPWPWGTKRGSKSVTFQANAASKEPLSIQFNSNWKEEERITLNGATKVTKETLDQ
jgi:hypothetical protein